VSILGLFFPSLTRVGRQTLALWLRYMRLSSCAYGVVFMTATGVTDAKNLFLGNERTVYERTGISPDKIIHAVWEAEGYAQPGWLLVQDDQAEILKSQHW
jgi:hypothetical protein